MTAPNTVEPGGAVWAVATRLTALDPNGFIIPGANVFVTDTLLKATITPVNEAGDAPTIKNAAGNLGLFAKKGDIPKWYTVVIELVTPDPQLEALLTGGTVYNDTTMALPAGTAPAVTTQATGGILKAGTYDYSTAQYNQYGPSEETADVQVVVSSGSANANIITPNFVAGALGAVIYGRYIGLLQQIGLVPACGVNTVSPPGTNADSGTGSVTSLTVTALGSAIPEGTQFTISGDTNTPPVVFTAAETGLVGAVTLAVEPVTVTTTIAPDSILPVFVDTGTVVPRGLPSQTDLTAGPGLAVGQQAHELGVVPNPYGIGLEFFMERIINGHQAGDYPFVRFVLPKVTNFVVGARDVTNAEMASVFTGDAFENPNWGTGPSGDWQFDSSKIFQWSYCSGLIVPTPSYVAQTAGF
jgi:hypothetical protein